MFQEVTAEQNRRLVLSLWGNTKEGKTHFALGAPRPLRWIDLDMGVLELLGKFPDLASGSGNFTRAAFNMTEQTDAGTFGQLLKDVHAAYLWALANSDGGTVVVDTATQLWQVVQTVKLYDVEQRRIETWKQKHRGAEPEPGDVRLYPYDYAAANSFYGGLLRRAMQQHKCNVLFLHRSKLEYGPNGQTTGRTLFQGFNETPAIVQTTIQMTRETGGEKRFVAKIENCRQNPEWAGLTVPNLEWETLREMLSP